MAEISVNGYGLSIMCRLCLSRDVTVLDIFHFSTTMRNRVAEVIMTCASVQIMKNDEMPNFICRVCYTQLEKIHQFQMQILQSDKTLRRYLQQLRVSDLQINTCSIQEPSENPSIYETNADITVKCESLGLHDVIDNMTEPMIDNSLSSTECASGTWSKDDCSEFSCEDTKIGFGDIILHQDMNVNWKEKEPGKFNSAHKINNNVKSEKQTYNVLIRPEYIDDIGDTNADNINVKCESLKLQEASDVGELTNNNSLFSTDYADDTFSKDDCSEFSCEDTKIGFGAVIFDEDTNVDWKEKESEKLNYSADKIRREVSSKSEHQADVLIRPGHINDTENAPFNGNSREISCEDTKPDIGHTSGIFANLRSEENNKNTSINRMKYKTRNKVIKKPYKCDVCNKLFTHSSSLIRHKRTHTSVKLHKCDVCNKCFTYSSNLKVHKRIHTGEKPYKCDFCIESFSDLSRLIYHKRTHTGDKPYKCDVCNKCFTLLSILNVHKRTHTGEKPYKCDVCNKSFIYSGNFNVHKRTHTGVKPYKCDVCNKCFTTSSELNVHKRIHTGERPHQCDVCNRCFIQSHHLNVHKRKHTGEKPYKCDICLKCCSNLSNLRCHQRTHTGVKPYKCDVCNKFLSSSASLINHKNTHTGVKPYKCDVCNKCFTISKDLKSHKRIHTGEKPYQCDVCNRCFTHSHHLQCHKRIHTGEKPYKCDDCFKCYRDASSLKYHKRTHTGVKPYKCDVCNKFLSSSASLNNHKNTHTGVKPYKCDVCNKCFTNSSHLKVHKYVHTGEKPYKCDDCFKCYSNVGNLRRHKRTHTGVKPYKY